MARQDVLNVSTSYFHKQLKQDTQAMNYMLNRGFSEELIDYFSIGFADGNIKPFMAENKYNIEDMLESKLMVEYDNKYIDFFRNRIMLPITMFGNTLYMSGRDLTGKAERKYLNLAVPNSVFINEELLSKSPKYVILTEGFMDCYTLLMHSYPAIGIAGCNRKKKGLLEKLLKIPTIYIMFDTDKNGAGQRGAVNTAYQLCKLGHQSVKVINIPAMGQDKMDINNMYLESKSTFAKLIQELLIQQTTAFNKTTQYRQMFDEELSKPFKSNDMSVEDTIKTYQKHLELQIVGNKLMRCPCPFHNETNPSFTIYLDNGFALCYGCDKRFMNGKEFEEEFLLHKKAKEIFK
jgi:DNA primase